MQSTCTGLHAPPAAIVMLPLIDMKPSDETCIYSTLLFVDLQAKKLDMPAACITGSMSLSTCRAGFLHARPRPLIGPMRIPGAVSYTHLTLPTNREV